MDAVLGHRLALFGGGSLFRVEDGVVDGLLGRAIVICFQHIRVAAPKITVVALARTLDTGGGSSESEMNLDTKARKKWYKEHFLMPIAGD